MKKKFSFSNFFFHMELPNISMVHSVEMDKIITNILTFVCDLQEISIENISYIESFKAMCTPLNNCTAAAAI